MKCNRHEEEGFLYVLGDLTESERVAYEEHMEECVFCARETAEYKRFFSLVRSDGGLETTVDPRRDAQIRRAIIAMRDRRYRWSLPLSFLIKKGTVAMCIVGVGFLSGLFVAGNVVMPNHGAPGGSPLVLEDSLPSDSLRDFHEGDGRSIRPVGVQQQR
ncbi:anti-sigma factor family protein [Chitinivibrio alkaliphilus]|uniref:Zinc-finger domain-containing protein n=1 Tax=Chitinivibrio alkaliphilus ACht1 TaxID=1313304 RepID=U7DBK1_9BACT|nr:hypothetical protein [Chitinivibrio alkaliphilus]ERP39402.1 hypothetical protein CALK_0205 [Chitinivibrio alkaliphilus ACht1]